MASVLGLIPTLPSFFPGTSSSSSSSSPTPCASILHLHENARRDRTPALNRRRLCARAMAQQGSVGGASAAYARDMERLSAKESLLLALKDAGGFEAYSKAKTTEIQRIDVMERITGLERLNPTPRPTTSPYLEGKWNVEWFGFDSPGFLVVRLLSERLPATLVSVSKFDVVFKEGSAKLIVYLSLLNSVATKLILSLKLTPEGPLRVKEEYVESTLESPYIIEEAVPEQLKIALAQASGAVQQFPIPVRDLLSNGLTVPLSGTFQRIFMISYLDEEILITRDGNGIPTVFTRLDQVLPAGINPTTDYVS